MKQASSIECPFCHWGFAPSMIKQHIREKHALPDGVTAVGLDDPAELHNTIGKALGES